MQLLFSGATSDEGENDEGRAEFYPAIQPTEDTRKTKQKILQESYSRAAVRIGKMKTRSQKKKAKARVKVPKGL